MTKGAAVHRAGPAPSEQALFALWDRLEEARRMGGESAALRLAQKALKAVERAERKEQTK